MKTQNNFKKSNKNPQTRGFLFMGGVSLNQNFFLRSLITLLLISILSGCGPTPKNKHTKYEDSFYDTFNTLIHVVAYTETQDEFNAYFETIHQRFRELHQLFDIYNNYSGINNIKTINDSAGNAPVPVRQEIIDLLLFSKEWYEKTDGATNIAMGPVLKIWRNYRENGLENPKNAALPPLDLLKTAELYTDINKVILNLGENTVFLEDEKMSLDVGAVAKGFATELVVEEIQEKGLVSGILNAGGNVHTIGKPLDNIRERWGVGIQNPNISIFSDQRTLDIAYINDASIVSSGDYQRYYIVDGKVIHHIIDPKTLFPGDYFNAVTIISPSSTLADFLSTSVFLLSFEEGKELVESIENTMALWVMKDGTIRVTENLKEILNSYGASGARKN
jgi:FAD:protein FMN transferase